MDDVHIGAVCCERVLGCSFAKALLDCSCISHRNTTLSFCLTPEQDDFDKIPELQVCIAEALYDAEAVLSNPSAFKAEEIRALRDQITSNLERAWEITGRSEDELMGVMVQISQVVAKQLSDRK